MDDSKAIKPFQRIQTAQEAYYECIEGGEEQQKTPGISFDCVRIHQKFERKNWKISYILNTIISDVILNLKACNLQNLLLTIRPCYLTG